MAWTVQCSVLFWSSVGVQSVELIVEQVKVKMLWTQYELLSQLMIVQVLKCWCYHFDSDRIILLTFSMRLATNISYLLPTYFFSNIRRQHRYTVLAQRQLRDIQSPYQRQEYKTKFDEKFNSFHHLFGIYSKNFVIILSLCYKGCRDMSVQWTGLMPRCSIFATVAEFHVALELNYFISRRFISSRGRLPANKSPSLKKLYSKIKVQNPTVRIINLSL